MSDSAMQVEWIRELAERVGSEISNWTEMVVRFFMNDVVNFVIDTIDIWGAMAMLRSVWRSLWDVIKLGNSYSTVFQMPVGDDMNAAYKEAVELYRTSTINYDYIPAITILVLLIIVWDYLHDIVVGMLPKALRGTVLDHRTYSFTAKICPVLITLILLPYTVYTYIYIYSPGELNTFSIMFPPSHPLFPVCIMVNVISIFYLSFRYIRAGFDSVSWRASLCLLAAVFGCIVGWYESIQPPAPVKYFFPYKVLYKYFYARAFVYIYMFNLAVVVYACVACTIFAFKKYHQRFSNKKPPKDD